MTEVTAKLRYLRIAPKKVRLVANAIKHMSVERAEAELMARSKRASVPILKLLRSAASNAKDVYRLNKSDLKIKNIFVDPGPVLKRILPRAMGRADPLWKRMSHVTIILEAEEGARPLKQTGAAVEAKLPEAQVEEGILIKKPETHPKTASSNKESRTLKGRKGFAPKLFRRKAI